MPEPIEVSIELLTQELLSLPATTVMVEIADLGNIDPLLQAGSPAANSPQAPSAAAADDSFEIELTAEQIDLLLSQTPAGLQPE